MWAAQKVLSRFGASGRITISGASKIGGWQIRIEIVAIAMRCRLRGIIACLNRANLTRGQPVLVEIARILLINLPVIYAAQLQERGKIETQVIAHKRKIIAGDPQIAEQARLLPVPRRHTNARNVEIAHLHCGKAFIVVVFKRVGRQGMRRDLKGFIICNTPCRTLRKPRRNTQPPPAPVAYARNMLREAIGGLVIAFDRIFNTRNNFFCSAVDHLLTAVRIKSVRSHIFVISVEIFEARICDQETD